MRICIFLCAFLYGSFAFSQESTQFNPSSAHPFYVGVDGGYGSTTWNGLVPAPANMNLGMMTSTPPHCPVTLAITDSAIPDARTSAVIASEDSG